MQRNSQWQCLWVILLGWALLLLDCRPSRGTEQESPLVPGNPARGRDVFVRKKCLSCHSVRGSGGRVGPDLAAAVVGKGTAGIAAAMLSHYPGMSAAVPQKQAGLALLSAREMEDMIAYLAFINFTSESGSAQRGRVLFAQKGCTKCHALAPGLVSLGPPLCPGFLSAPPILVAQEMWNHATQMSAKMRELKIQRPTFAGNQMADILAFLGAPVAPLPGPDASLPGDPILGRQLFQSKGCAQCHIRGKSGDRIGPDILAPGWYKTPTQIAAAMWNHEPAMWAKMLERDITPPHFKHNEMTHVIAYLYLIRCATEPGDPELGREVFSRGHCTQCHRSELDGPNLASINEYYTPIHLAAAMWNHGPRMQAFLTAAGLPWPTFEGADVLGLVGFLSQQAED